MDKFKNSMRFFLKYTNGNIGDECWACVTNFGGEYSWRPWRERDLGLGKMNVYLPLDNYSSQDLKFNTRYEFFGLAGMLEVEDALQRTNTLVINFPSSK